MIDPGPCVAGAGVDFIRPVQTNVFFWKIRIAGPGHARSSLAVVAMTDVDYSRLARDDDAELTAKALRGSFHDSPSEFLILGTGLISITSSAPAYNRCGRGNETLDLPGLSIASSSSSSDRGEIPRARNPGRFSETAVSICMSST